MNLKAIWSRMEWQERTAWVLGTAFTAFLIIALVNSVFKTDDPSYVFVTYLAVLLTLALVFFAVGIPSIPSIGERRGWSRRRNLMTMAVVCALFAVLLGVTIWVLVVYAALAGILLWASGQASKGAAGKL